MHRIRTAGRWGKRRFRVERREWGARGQPTRVTPNSRGAGFPARRPGTGGASWLLPAEPDPLPRLPLRRLGEDFGARFGHEHHILHAHAAAAQANCPPASRQPHESWGNACCSAPEPARRYRSSRSSQEAAKEKANRSQLQSQQEATGDSTSPRTTISGPVPPPPKKSSPSLRSIPCAGRGSSCPPP